jgi:hypothetical protein
MTTVRGQQRGKSGVIQIFGMNENPVGIFGASVPTANLFQAEKNIVKY